VFCYLAAITLKIADSINNPVMKNTNYTITRIHKERLIELGILSKEYGVSRTEIINNLVQAEFQRFLEDQNQL